MSHAIATVVRLDQQLRAEFEVITPERAEQYLGKNTGNRSYKVRKIAAYARDMEAGSFVVTGEAIKFDWNGRLIDGQNRLAAIINAGREVTTLVVRGLDPDVQMYLDSGAKRTHADALKIHGASGNLNSLAAVVRIVASYKEGTLPTAHSRAREFTHAETLAFYDENADLLTVADTLADRWARRLYTPNSALAAAIFLTMEVDPVEAHRFFQTTVDMENFTGKDDPRAVLLRRLQSLRSESWVSAQFLYFILRAWNAWRSDKPLVAMKDMVRGTGSRIPEPK